MTGITDPTEPYFKDGQWGWDGTQWRKLPLLWGYYDTFDTYKADLDTIAGQEQLAGIAVPAGEVHVLQSVAAVNEDSICDSIRFDVVGNAGLAYIKHVASPPAGIYTCWNGEIVLKEGCGVRAVFFGCTLHDHIKLYFWGYKMLIAE